MLEVKNRVLLKTATDLLRESDKTSKRNNRKEAALGRQQQLTSHTDVRAAGDSSLQGGRFTRSSDGYPLSMLRKQT